MRKYAIFVALSCAMIITLCGSVSAASPSANFTANTTNGVGPVTVQFTDTSTGNITSWNWNFGDNATSTQQNPVHTYTALGAHNVTLSVANSDGCNSLEKTNYITVWNVSSMSNNNGIDIYVANDAGVKYDMPNGVTTSAQYGGVYPYTPNTYYISEGGGGTNPIQLSANPNLIPGYNAPATYVNTNNQSGTFYVVFRGGILHLDDAILMLAVNGTIPADFSVTISASGYNYTLPVPATSNPSMSSLTNITYVNSTLNETFYKSDLIYNQNWRPYNVVSGESQLINGINEYPIYYGENLTDPNNNFHLMFIDLDAAGFSPTSGLANLINNGAITVNYSFNDLQGLASFAAYGFFSACNWGTGIPQASYNGLCGYNVQGIPPVTPAANFTATNKSGTAPLNVQFTDTSSNSPTSWLWNFGDGGSSTQQNPDYTYTIPGTYNVTLTAINSAGNNTIIENNLITVNYASPIAGFTENTTSGLNPLNVQFSDQSTGNVTSYYWTFGNGGSSTLQNPTYTYNIAGIYTVTLTASNAYGNNTVTMASLIDVIGPVADNTTGLTYNTIESAVNAAKNGDTILVNAGNYIENVILNKNLILEALGQVNVTALDTTQPVFLINNSGSGSTIEGFTISGSTNSGIYINNATGNTILNNTIFGNNSTSWGICLVNSNGPNYITGNNVTNCIEGINLYGVSGASITNNAATNSVYDGIALTLSNNNTITNNNGITLNVSGIRLNNSNNNTVANNNLTGNIWTSISLVSSQYNQFTSNTASNNQEGMYLYSSNNNTITGTIANNNTWDGIAIANSNNNTVENNNNITNNNSGIRIIGASTGNQVLNNTVIGNTWADMSLDTAGNTIISGNIFSNSEEGIFVYNSNGNTITNNTMNNDLWDGIYIGNSSNNNTITGDIISNGSGYGVRIQSSTGNTIVTNDFINNYDQAYDDSNNTWNNTTTGNYYSDWNSTNPRPVDGGTNIDQHPSTTAF